MPSAAKFEFSSYRREVIRAVDGQQQSGISVLVDSFEAEALLDQLIDQAKPPVPQSVDAKKFHFLLSTPFRHPPLRYGSRFGTRHDAGIFYAAEEERTALAETAYYLLVFLSGTKAKLQIRSERSTFRVRAICRQALDLSRSPFLTARTKLSSPTDYAAAQKLGREAREAGVTVIRYFSARDSDGGLCVAVLEPSALVGKPKNELNWLCLTQTDGVEFRLKTQTAEARRYAFPREQFLVAGKLPTPAL